MQILPSIDISGFVRHYLFLEGEGVAVHRLRLFPDGNTGIVVNTASPLTLEGQLLPDAFLYGQITEFKDIYCHGPARLFVVVVRPDGFNRLFGLDASELKDRVVVLGDVFGDEGDGLLCSLSGAVMRSLAYGKRQLLVPRMTVSSARPFLRWLNRVRLM